MVQVQRPQRNGRSLKAIYILVLFALVSGGIIYLSGETKEDVINDYESISNKVKSQIHRNQDGSNSNSISVTKSSSMHSSSSSNSAVVSLEADSNSNAHSSIPCGYKRMSDLKDYEAFPKVTKEVDGNNRRHAYDPPKDGIVTLVCCETTAGPLSVAVHTNWAKLGAENFLRMVKTNYFSSKVALMRCVHNFICQFGIAGDPKLNRQFGSFPDDPNWLKEGKPFRTNAETGAKRYARGYFAYAGSGKNSRGNQLIVALGDNKMLGGGSPWEVPFGEVVGADSYNTLAKISTVYGEKGPTQGLLHREGSSENVAKKFPELDYVLSCSVVDSKDFGSKS